MGPRFKRVLLKLSGEALMGDQQFGVDPVVATRIARDVGDVQSMGVQTAIVIGTIGAFALALPREQRGMAVLLAAFNTVRNHVTEDHRRRARPGEQRAPRPAFGRDPLQPGSFVPLYLPDPAAVHGHARR